MKKESIFSNKTFLIVLSVIIAFVSWVVVSLDSNDTKGRTISGLSIDMDQVDDTISELGLSIISSDDTRVAVRVEGVTYAIGNLKPRTFASIPTFQTWTAPAPIPFRCGERLSAQMPAMCRLWRFPRPISR